MKIWKSMTFWYLLALLAMPLILLANEPATQPADQAKPTEPAEPKDPADVMQPVDPANAIIQLPDGRTVNLADLQAQGGGNFVFVRAAGMGGGDRSIEVNEDDRKITINENADEIVVTIKEGNAEPVEYRAKDAEELEEKHPEAFEVYEKYAQDFQGQLPGVGAMAAGGRVRIALAGPGGGGGPGFAFAHGHGFEVESLGASCIPIWDEFIKSHLGDGVRVVEVQEDTPASELGLQQLDMIKSISGKKVTNAQEIEQAIEEAGGADKITIEVLRAGQTVKLEHK